jgi:predicted Fe-Mo cluster-binding NifX family protein
MKIAVVTDDSKTISAHFGRAQYYAVFTITDNQSWNGNSAPKANHSHFAGEGMVTPTPGNMGPIPPHNTGTTP